MSARTFSAFTVIGFAAIPFVACGGDDGNKIDSGIVVHDSSGSGSGSGSGSNVTCASMASYTPNFGSNNSAEINAGSDLAAQGFPQHNVFVGALENAQTPVLQIDIVGGAGSANSPDWPVNLGPASNINVAMAKDVQVAIFAGSDGSQIYLASAGTLNVTAASKTTGQTFSGSLANATFVHVDISGNQATPDPDGCQTNIANATWSGALQAPMFTGKPAYHTPVLFHRYQ
jgi:hypothetical protein